MPIEQAADLFFFLPKLGMADPWTAIAEVIQSFFDFPRREVGGEISQACPSEQNLQVVEVVMCVVSLPYICSVATVYGIVLCRLGFPDV